MRTGKRVGLLTIAIAVWVAHDLFVPPQFAIDARAAVAVINQYRAHVSPHLRGVIVCRFQPTCSYYGRESIRKRGLLIGGMKAFVRIARCGPWTPQGTVDPP